MSKERTSFDQGSVLDVISDLQWAVFSGIDRQTQADTLSYDRIGSNPTAIPIDTPYLHVVPLADLKSHSGKLSAGQDFRLLGCA